MKNLATHPPKAVIFGCEGTRLSEAEKAFFAEQQPYGFILFARNLETPQQVRALVDEMRDTVGGRNAPVLIDQEGGRVARLRPPHWRKYPPARHIADMADHDPELAAELTFTNTRLIAEELHALGINVDCLPLADVPAPGSHDIIGDRAYGTDPGRVALLARKAADGLLAGGVLPVLKHIPGHGRAEVDSHEALPVVNASLEELRQVDFPPFRALSDLPLGMTAHVLYQAIDPENVATLSTKVLEVIRGELRFDGLLMTDDISMKALKGAIGELSARSLQAGCDLVLHCNGDMAEMQAIAAAVPPMSPEAVRRALHAQAQWQEPQAFDTASAEAKLAAALPQECA